MIRKFMVGAVAAAMPVALLSTGAGAAAPKPPKPVITSASVNAVVAGDVNGGLYNGTTVGYFNTVDITVSGTALNTTLMKTSDIVISPISGFTAFLGHTGAWTINSVTNKSATGFKVNATVDNFTWSLLGGGTYSTKAAKPVSITGGGATLKNAGFNIGSNCGPQDATADPAVTLPKNSKTGASYVDADFGSGAGQSPDMFKPFYKSLPSAYTDITVLSTALLGSLPKPPVLCSADLGLEPPITATSTLGANGYYGWAKNYGVWANGHQLPAAKKTGNAVDVKKGALGNATYGGLSFSFPITTVGGVNVTNSVIRYNIPKGVTVGGCAAETSASASAADLVTWNAAQPADSHHFFRDAASTTCSVSGSVITVTDSADRFFDEGTFLDAPSIKLTGVHTAKAGTYNFTLGGTTSTITLSGNSINIGFNPAPKSKSLTAPFFALSMLS